MQTNAFYRYEFLDINDPAAADSYERFVAAQENGCFMQSVKWHRVKTNWGAQAVIAKDKENEIRGAMLILVKTLPIVKISYLYAPRGPVCDFKNHALLDCLFEGARKLSVKYKACAFKIDPFAGQDDTAFLHFMQTRGFSAAPHAQEDTAAQTRCNYLLNVENKTPEQLFASFKPKWRYNIRLAQRKGVVCTVCGKEALGDFMQLMEQTGKRDGFAIRSKAYFEQMLHALSDDCRLYMCYKGSTALSGAICVRFGARTCYVYGASSNAHRALMPNYLMQWSMISWAQESGCKMYDFMGIPHYDDPQHSNYGVYQFKQGFCGEVAVYAGEFEYVYDRKKKVLWDICFCLYRLFLRMEHRIKQGISPSLGKQQSNDGSMQKPVTLLADK